MNLVEVITKVIEDEGGKPGNSFHSWRCEYPDTYGGGPCDCVAQVAAEILTAIEPALQARIDGALFQFAQRDINNEIRLGNAYNAGWRDACEAIALGIEAMDIIRVEAINGQAIPLVNLADTARIARRGGKDE